MATVLESLRRSSVNIKEISKSINSTEKEISSVEKSLNNISSAIEKKTRIKSSLFQQSSILEARRREASKRREIEDQLEASRSSTSPQRGLRVAQSSTKSPLGRLLDFLGFLTAGWILENLPTWIAIGKEFIDRLQKARFVLENFLNNVRDVFLGFGNVLQNSLNAIIKMDFSEFTSGSVLNSFHELNDTIEKLGNELYLGYKMLTEPLTGDIPDTGEQEPDTMFPGIEQETLGGGQIYESTGGQQIKKSEFGNRGFRTRDGLGSGRTAFGHTGRDVGMPEGTPLSIVPGGVVVEASYGYNGGYGNFVVIKLDNGRYIKLNHLSKILVKEGDRVGPGSGKNGGVRVVGLVGSTGLSTGPHMHIDLGTGYNRGPAQLTGLMDPDSFILGGGVVRGGNVKSSGQVTQSASSGVSGQPSTPQQTLMGQPSSKAGKRFSIPELVSLAKQAGFKGDNAEIAAAIAYAESTGNSMAHNKKRPDNSYGLWQINMIDDLGPSRRKQFGLRSNEDLFDPLTNAKVAYKMSGGSNFNPWATFNPRDRSTPKYLNFLPEARKSSGVNPSSLTASETPQTPQSTPPLSQINVTGQPSQAQMLALQTPERKGRDFLFIEQTSPTRSTISSGSNQRSNIRENISDQTLLNNFIKKKLLIDLAYL